jgi:mannose-6-phosphate isomerase
MRKIAFLRNKVQNYAWGSVTAIPELLGQNNPGHEPVAELWMGAHTKAPSLVECDGKWQSLKELIENTPREILGDEVARRFDDRLPYLFKVLAAAKPLSIQAHPDRDQAREGFERENERGIALDAPDRNYRDDNHKPECICALSPFWALHGFREISDIIDLMQSCCPHGLADELHRLQKQPAVAGLKRFFTDLMTLGPSRRLQVVVEALQNAQNLADKEAAFQWMIKIADEYPSDIGVLSPILLNLIQLKPGQALFLPAGELHAYLEGVGIELMANSDNVLRGGLTPKHIDVPELLKVLSFDPHPVSIVEPVEISESERVYTSAANEFVLSVISLSNGRPYHKSDLKSIEILLCTDGTARIETRGGRNINNIKKGDSVIVPAAVEKYGITGDAILYKAAVPL